MEDISDAPRVDRRHLIGGAAAVAAGVALGSVSGSSLAGAQDTGTAPAAQPFMTPGACTYLALDPFRICDTRPGAQSGGDGYERINSRIIRVPVANRGGAPANARAAVLNVTAINRGNPAFVTVYPADTGMPTASNINLAQRGVAVPNLVTVMLGGSGDVMIYVDGTADIVVDLAGVYIPASGPARAGRMEVRANTVRVLDTRNRGFKVPADGVVDVILNDYVPSHAQAASINLTATEASGLGFFTAYPFGIVRPWASNLNVETAGETRAVGAIVKIGTDPATGNRGFRVYSSHGSHVVVDLNGHVTGEGAAMSEDGMFVPSAPQRLLDTRWPGQIGRLWAGWTVEFELPAAIRPKAQAIAMNLTTDQTRDAGFFTVYAARTGLPLASNLNPTAANQQLANHVITRASAQGVAVYSARGGHVIADLAGYYTGQPANGLWPRPTNPEPPPPQLPYALTVPRLGWTAWVYGGGDANRVVDAGHVWHWAGTGLLGQRSNMALFAHRTEANSLLRYQHYLRPGDEIIMTSNDGRKWRYVYAYDWVTDARATNILAATRFRAAPTISLISCTKPNKLPTDLKWRLITTFTFDRWYE